MFHEPQAPYEFAPEGENDADATVLYRSYGVRERWEQGRWKMPLIIFLGALTVYSLFAWERLGKPSADTHFVYLANTYNSMIAASFSDEAAQRREGKVAFELDRKPPHRNDWASYWEITLKSGETYKGIWLDRNGQFKTLDGRAVLLDRKATAGAKRTQRFFVSFPPAPAVMMMPLAAISDYNVNDVWFTLFFAAFNVMLMFLLLRRMSEGGRTGRGQSEVLWLTALFAFGTAHFWCSVLGQVWFTALVIGVTFTLLYIICAIDGRHPLLAGIFLACAFSTRTPLLFSAVFFYLMVLFPGGTLRKDNWQAAAKQVALFSAPCVAVGLTLLYMNHVRFDSLSEFGHTYLAAGGLQRIKTYGLFNAHFLSKNLTAALTLLPKIQPDDPYVLISRHGMSLLLTTPVFIYLFRPLPREDARDRFWWNMLWVTVICVATPALFYQNTGYEQFGYRFSLDYTPYLILLLAVGRRPLSRVFKALVIFGVAVNAFGAVTFKRFHKFYSNGFFL